MFWIATFDTRNALPSLNRQSPHFHDKSLSCGKVQGFSHHGNILIFIIFMSGTGTEKVRQMYRKAAGPSWYRRKFMNSTLRDEPQNRFFWKWVWSVLDTTQESNSSIGDTAVELRLDGTSTRAARSFPALR